MDATSPTRWNCGGETKTYDWNAAPATPAQTTRFVVIGDVHYCNVDDQGDPAEARMERLAADLKAKKFDFDFVIQVGDLVNCQTGYTPRAMSECHAEWRHAISEVKRLFPDKPFFTTPGNHDWYGGDSWQGGLPCIKEHYVPFMERELGAPLNGLPFFTFRHGECLFVFLNHVGMYVGFDIEQRNMLEKALAAAERNPAVARVFAVSHPELWNVDYFRFNENATLLPLFMKAKKFDAYFSGHVHMNNVTARKNDYNMALRQVCVAGTWPPVKEGPDRFHAVPRLDLNPGPATRIFADHPDDVESYTVVTASRDSVRLRFEAVGGGCIGEYEWRGPYEVKAVKPAAPRFSHEMPAKVERARLYLQYVFVDRVLGAAPAPRVRVNGRDVGELKRKYAAFEVNWGRFFLELPPEIVRESNTVEIENPSGERFLVRDLSIMAAGGDGAEHFTPVHPKVLSFGDWRHFYMGFGLVHIGCGILHSGVDFNIAQELIETVDRSAMKATVSLGFSNQQETKQR